MTEAVLLDAVPLGMISHPRASGDIVEWLAMLVAAGVEVLIPEVADFEVRRELLRTGRGRGIERLDLLKASLGFVPITSDAMLRAAAFWADARRRGRPTASDQSLDADAVLAGQAVLFASLVDDPSSDPEANKLSGETREHWVGEERQRLHRLIEQLVPWENSNNRTVIRAARCVAPLKLERGELKKAAKLPSGKTVTSLLTKGRARIDLDGVIHADHLPPAPAEPLADAEFVIFVDVQLAGRGKALEIRSVEPSESCGTIGHESDPRSLVAQAQAVYGCQPRACLITIPAADFPLGEGISSITKRRADPTLARICSLLHVDPPLTSSRPPGLDT